MHTTTGVVTTRYMIYRQSHYNMFKSESDQVVAKAEKSICGNLLATSSQHPVSATFFQ